ncbi:hypothetical protein AVV44_gp052 [Cronobacter phage S13]|jgi:hypothetical protein|uniref:Uncharacterized protein n=1 Tax=Cronobacter phage LPCS28 TaxID=2924885 RepID=A0AAE9K5A8_9CAUD|nr:hypothetical protein AVV44_gp052 [Cronobacter phage S13]YP_010665903.1 hypothetical protein PQB73_gp121 [Cronobacter phage LPCS28]AIA64851.1 hypothetical protein S13_052 [Cronobacter phage S13]UNY47092.1 hypothetical protein EHEKIMEA_00210 [Cronobacter phage LPCS28]
MQLRKLVYQDVRDAVNNLRKVYPMTTKLMSCKTYCQAFSCSYDEPYCIKVIDSMESEPGDRYVRFLPEGWEIPEGLETA